MLGHSQYDQILCQFCLHFFHVISRRYFFSLRSKNEIAAYENIIGMVFWCWIVIEYAIFIKAGRRLLKKMNKFYLPLDKGQNLTAAAMERQK